MGCLARCGQDNGQVVSFGRPEQGGELKVHFTDDEAQVFLRFLMRFCKLRFRGLVLACDRLGRLIIPSRKSFRPELFPLSAPTMSLLPSKREVPLPRALLL